MAKDRVNPLLEQEKRRKEQEQLVAMAKPQPDKSPRKKPSTQKPRTRKVPMNITIPKESKKKILRYASKKKLSASVLIQLWIDEHCVD